MTPDLLTETPVTLSAVARTIPGARGATRISPTTVWRWCVKGTNTPDGRLVKLEYYRVGARVMTTAEAVRRYITALTLTPTDAPTQPAARTPSERQRASEKAAKELERMGA